MVAPGRKVVPAALLVLAGSGHVVYPAALLLWTYRRQELLPPEPTSWPGLTVAVPAYREEAVIAAKIDDLVANGYPGPLEVVVVADDEATAKAATGTVARVVTRATRRGKADAVNAALAEAKHAIVVLSDANTTLAPGSLGALALWFADPAVGAVAGEKSVSGRVGEDIYWRFESWLKRREARTGATVGLVGELFAVRKSAFRTLPVDLAAEDLWLALDILEQKLRIAYEPRARAMEDASPSWSDDWQRRTRVVSGVLDVIWRRRNLLVSHHGATAAQLWGHRLVRSTLGPLAHVGLLGLATANVGKSRVARFFVGLHVAGAVAAVRGQRGRSQSMPEGALGQVLTLQVMGLGGFVRYLRRDRPALWPKPPRSLPPRTR